MRSLKEKRVTTDITRIIINYLEKLNIDLSDLADKTESSYSLFTEPDHKIPINSELLLWQYAMQKTEDSHIGISMAGHFNFKSIGVVGYLARQQPTLLRMMETYCHYHRIIHEEAILKPICQEEADIMEHHFSKPGEGPGQSASEFTLATIWQTFKQVSAQPISLKKVCFQHPKPSSVQKYKEFFGDTVQFEFSQPTNQLHFPPKTLNTPTLEGDSQLGDILKSYADQALASLPAANDLEHSLYGVISELMAENNLNIDSVAYRMGMSRRTLQRRLKDKKLTFSTLVEEVQKRHALRYLEDPSINITEVAFLCGFSELSPFSRAFKRWTGMSPKEFRKV